MVSVVSRIQSGNIEPMYNINIVGDYRVKVRFWGITFWSRKGHFEKAESFSAGGSRAIDLPGPLALTIEPYDTNITLTLVAEGFPYALWAYSGSIPTEPIKVRTSWKGGEVTAYVSITTA